MIPELAVTEEEAEMLVKVLRGPVGTEFEKFLQRIVNTSSFSKDPGVMAFLEGRRQIALVLTMAAKIGKSVVGDDYVDPNSIDNTEEKF